MRPLPSVLSVLSVVSSAPQRRLGERVAHGSGQLVDQDHAVKECRYAFVVSRLNSYMTGANINVDGGSDFC